MSAMSCVIAASGCSQNYIETSLDPKVCESWQEINPSRKEDKLSKKTAHMIAGNNVAREAWCSSPPEFGSARVRA